MSEKPIRWSISPKAIIRDDAGRALVIRRSMQSKHWPGMWDLVGGKMDPGETFDQCLIREAKEETGLVIAITGFLGASPCDLSHVRLIFLIMEARMFGAGGLFHLSDEHSESRWCTAAELAGLDFIPPIAALLRGGG